MFFHEPEDHRYTVVMLIILAIGSGCLTIRTEDSFQEQEVFRWAIVWCPTVCFYISFLARHTEVIRTANGCHDQPASLRCGYVIIKYDLKIKHKYFYSAAAIIHESSNWKTVMLDSTFPICVCEWCNVLRVKYVIQIIQICWINIKSIIIESGTKLAAITVEM